jgi:hypothetical protein
MWIENGHGAGADLEASDPFAHFYDFTSAVRQGHTALRDEGPECAGQNHAIAKIQ